MRHLRSFAALLTIAAVMVACSPASSSGGESQGGEASQGGGASEPAASTGGGGGGGGANGSVTYEIKGDYEASGELPFVAAASTWIDSAGGWVANFANPSGGGDVVLINTQSAEGTPGQIFTFGNGEVILGATSDPGSGFNCTFTLTKNDSSGLTGDVNCTSAIAVNNTTGEQKHVTLTAHWDAHP